MNSGIAKVKGVSLVCPAYYDADNIAPLIKKADQLFSSFCEDYEIIVVNDGSPDNTKEVLERLSLSYSKLRAIHHQRNLGYAEALKTGLKQTGKFEYILLTDGDNQYDVEYFRDMIKHIPEYDVIITYRAENANSFLRKVISRIFNRILNILYWEPFTDLSSSFRLVKKNALDEIKDFSSNGIFFPIELILRLYKKNFKIKEIPISTKRRLHGRSTSLLPKNFAGAIKEMLALRGKINGAKS